MKIVCIGFSSLDIIMREIQRRPEGQTSFAQEISFATGGDAMNEALTLKALGHPVTLVTQVGRDMQGDLIRQTCQEAGLPTDFIFRGDFPTAVSVITVQADGQRSIVGMEENTVKNFKPGQYALDAIDSDTGLVCIGSLYASQYLGEQELLQIFQKAKNCGAITAADFINDRKDWTLDTLGQAYSLLDYAIPSIEEAQFYTGQADPAAAARKLQEYGVKNVVIKLGSKGVYGNFQGLELEMPCLKCPVVDTTGAGDNFTAGFLSALVRGLEPEQCLRFATGTAAVSIGQMGAHGAVRSMEQVEEFLSRYE